MKKLFFAVLSLGVLASVSLTAKENVVQSCKFNKKLEDELTTAQNMTVRYGKNANKAEAEGNENLSKAYQACSDAKDKLANSLSKYISNSEKAYSIASSDEKLSSLIDSTLAYYKKGERLTSRIKKLQACKTANADNAEFASALENMIQGLQEYTSAQKEFKSANANLRALKKKA